MNLYYVAGILLSTLLLCHLTQNSSLQDRNYCLCFTYPCQTLFLQIPIMLFPCLFLFIVNSVNVIILLIAFFLLPSLSFLSSVQIGFCEYSTETSLASDTYNLLVDCVMTASHTSSELISSI